MNDLAWHLQRPDAVGLIGLSRRESTVYQEGKHVVEKVRVASVDLGFLGHWMLHLAKGLVDLFLPGAKACVSYGKTS